MSFWVELKRRNVAKVGAAYLVVAWLLAQVVDLVLPTFEAPEWVTQTVIFLLILGFPIILIVAWAFEITPDGLRWTSTVPRAESITSITGHRLNYFVTALLAVAVIFLVFDNYVFDDAFDSAANATITNDPIVDQAAAFGDRLLPNSVAVIPFTNLSPNQSDAYFAAGIHEEILNQLVKLSSLNVIARTSVMQYADTQKTIPEIARELNVESVMEGSVRYADGQVLVTTQLIDAATNVHLWSNSYQRDFSNIFSIQADIAMNVANALRAEFSIEEQERIERRLTDSPAAYALFLQVSQLANVPNSAQRVHELMDQAIEIDPNFARAYAIKASNYAAQLINTTAGSAMIWNELEPLVREYARMALEIDDEDPVALFALARINSYSWRWTLAQQEFDRIFRLTGRRSSDSIWHQAWSGDPGEAARHMREFMAINPLDARGHWVNGIALNYAGDYDAALEAMAEANSLAPTVPAFHSWLAWTYLSRGDFVAARRELEIAERLLGDNRAIILLIDLAYGYGRAGDEENAHRVFEEVNAIAEQGQEIGAGGWAMLHLATGNDEQALEQLRAAVAKASQNVPDAGYFSLMNIKMNVTANPLLERADFVDVRNQLRGD